MLVQNPFHLGRRLPSAFKSPGMSSSLEVEATVEIIQLQDSQTGGTYARAGGAARAPRENKLHLPGVFFPF